MSSAMANDIGSRVLDNLGCAPNDLVCAQSKTATEITAAEIAAAASMQKLPEYAYAPAFMFMRPVVDGDLITSDLDQLIRSGLHNSKAKLMIGSTRNEFGIAVGPMMPNLIPMAEVATAVANFTGDNERLGQVLRSPFYQFDPSDKDTIRNMFTLAETDFYATCPIHAIARQLAQHNPKVYVFQMANGVQYPLGVGEPTIPFCDGKVCHAADIIPSFGSLDVVRGILLKQTGDIARMARVVIDRFSIFATTGNANPSPESRGQSSTNPDVTSAQWRPYSKRGKKPVMVLGVPESSLHVDENNKRCDWIESNLKYEYQLNGSSSYIHDK